MPHADLIAGNGMRCLLVTLALLTGCTTPIICDYDLTRERWYPIDTPPANLEEGHRRISWHWFTNDSDDFLACYELKSRDLCGNVYTLYRRTQGLSFREEEIVCTR